MFVAGLSPEFLEKSTEFSKKAQVIVSKRRPRLIYTSPKDPVLGPLPDIN